MVKINLLELLHKLNLGLLRISLINNIIQFIQIQQYTIYTEKHTYEHKYSGLKKVKVKSRYSSQ